MTTPAELALTCTDLTPAELAHLQRLLGSWSVLADLSFSDLFLVAPTTRIPGEEPELVVMGQIRPNNRPTLLEQDLVGQTVSESSWRLAAAALERGELVRGAVHHPMIGEAVPVENVPVRFGGKVIGVMVRVYSRLVHAPMPYEKNYLDVFERLVQMIMHADFPFPEEDVGTEETPRVGDGFVLVDAEGRVEFASPNAVNAFHRMGIYSAPEGKKFTELGIARSGAGDGSRRPALSGPVGESAVRRALAGGRPVVEEAERRPDVVVLVQCIPLIEEVGSAGDGAGERTGDGAGERTPDSTPAGAPDRAPPGAAAGTPDPTSGDAVGPPGDGAPVRTGAGRRAVTGAVVLMRDVTDVRRLDRLLLSKDAAIREVHHRVKNNLQTISSLLSLQARRLTSEDGRAALNEAERRVRSIAVVHEILSRDPGDQVPFGEIVESLVRMAEDSVVSATRVEISVRGDLGEVSADVATPLAVTLAELLQNAVEHAFADDGSSGHVEVRLESGRGGLSVTVRDDGRGLEEGFDIERTTSLGLSIVRDLVVSQLGGSIEMGAAEGGGTEVSIRVPPEHAGWAG